MANWISAAPLTALALALLITSCSSNPAPAVDDTADAETTSPSATQMSVDDLKDTDEEDQPWTSVSWPDDKLVVAQSALEKAYECMDVQP